MKILFILKEHFYGIYGGKASGLRYSAQFVSDMLNEQGFVSKTVTVVDNNDIDRETTAFGADVVIIEALWVVPEKFDVLKKLHPNVRWVVRIHSELPFLANEGIAIQWIFGYAERGISIAFNSARTTQDFTSIGINAVYLPNYYPTVTLAKKVVSQTPGYLQVGCFGAIRPLKNQLTQAVAAINYAEKNNLILKFNINMGRVESGGEPVLKSLLALFSQGKRELIQHGWADHDNFLWLMSQMDISLSVSFTETFSIITADAVSQRVPIVTSSEVSWADPKTMADPTDSEDIYDKMGIAMKSSKKLASSNISRLNKFSSQSVTWWKSFLSPKKSFSWL